MSVIDLDSLLRPISEENPCGENLEYSPVFMELEQALDAVPPPMFEAKKKEEDKGRNWEDVRDKAIEFFEQSKDLRITLVLIRALLGADGLVGFQQGVALLGGLVDAYWEQIHPQVTPEDEVYRTNILAGLVDSQTITAAVRTAPLVTARGYGSFSLRDTELASGAVAAPEGAEVPKIEEINGAFMEADIDTLQRDVAAGRQVIADLDALAAPLAQKGVELSSEHLSRLKDALRDMLEVLASNLAKRGVEMESTLDDAKAAADATAGGPASVIPQPQPSGGIQSRADVIRQLDRICEYLEKNEPSSPVPLLLHRAKRLVSKNFMEIINDMAPDGVAQAKLIGGLDTDNQ